MVYPVPSSGIIGPRIIQPPVPNHRDPAPIPEDANFVQAYSKHRKTKTNSNFGALVRSIEFEYDIADTITISARLTSGFDEGQMTGVITMMLDQYELTYENKAVQVREYVEELAYEMVRPDQDSRVVYDPIGNAVQNSNNQGKRDKVIRRSQLFNQVSVTLESEDARFITRSKTLYFIVELENCKIIIYPNKDQIRFLKRMIQKHYFAQPIIFDGSN